VFLHDLDDAERVIAVTRDWLQKTVIGLELCPFSTRVRA